MEENNSCINVGGWVWSQGQTCALGLVGEAEWEGGEGEGVQQG